VCVCVCVCVCVRVCMHSVCMSTVTFFFLRCMRGKELPVSCFVHRARKYAFPSLSFVRVSASFNPPSPNSLPHRFVGEMASVLSTPSLTPTFLTAGTRVCSASGCPAPAPAPAATGVVGAAPAVALALPARRVLGATKAACSPCTMRDWMMGAKQAWCAMQQQYAQKPVSEITGPVLIARRQTPAAHTD
jgi:hypothetical protein